MEENVAKAIGMISAFSAGLPLLVGLLGWQKLKQIQRYILALIVFSIFIELLSLWIGRYLHLSNLFLLHLFSVGQLVLLWLIFRQRLIPPFSRRFFLGTLLVFLLFAVASAIWIDGLFNFNSHARSFEAVIIIFFCLSYFYQRLKQLDLENLESDPLFWVSTGSLVYFSGSLIMFIISNYVASNQEMSFSMWAIHAILNTFNNIFFMIALWVRPTT